MILNKVQPMSMCGRLGLHLEKAKTILFIFIAIITIALDASAADKIYLFGDYYVGMSLEELLKEGDAQCDKYPDGEMVCNRRNVRFASIEWTQFFAFNANGLNCVAFGRPLSITTFESAMSWFQEEDYIPIKAEAGKNSLNFARLYEKNGASAFKKEADHFTRDLPSSDIFNSYLIKQSDLDSRSASDRLPDDAIVASMGASKSQGTFFVCFEPAMNFTFLSLR